MDSNIKDSCWINFMIVKSHQIISNCWIDRRIYDPLHSIKLQFSFTNSSMETDYSTWLRNDKLLVVLYYLYLQTSAQAFQLHFWNFNSNFSFFPNVFSNYIYPVATCHRLSNVFPRFKLIAGIVNRSVRTYKDLIIPLEIRKL